MTFLKAVALPFLIVMVWAIASWTGLIDALFLPSPLSVGKALVVGLYSGGLSHDLMATVIRSFAGFFLAIAIGIPAGLIVGRNPGLAKLTQPTIDFFRSVPATALFPLFLFCFGIGDAAKLAVVVYACSLIVLVNTAYGAMQVKTSRLLAARVMGANNWDSFWKVVVPESAPGIFAGLRIALSLSFVLIIVTEMFIGTTVGLGYQIVNAQMVYAIPEMYAGIVLVGVVGFSTNVGLLQIQKKVLHWVGT